VKLTTKIKPGQGAMERRTGQFQMPKTHQVSENAGRARAECYKGVGKWETRRSDRTLGSLKTD